MRKPLFIAASILVLIIIVIIAFMQNYKGSPDYNYLTAKFDIKDGNIRIIHTGYRMPCLKDSEIDLTAATYGFKNIWIGYDTTAEKIKGIKNYNELMKTYLTLRNGNDWWVSYQKEVDSLYKVSFVQPNAR